jgi:hypothetical protein
VVLSDGNNTKEELPMLRKSLMTRVVIVIGMIVIVLCGFSIGAEHSTGADEANIGTALGVSQDTMVLDGKGDDYVLFCKRRYEVTTYTVIKNERGMLISLNGLLVPCKAMVSYYKKPGVKNTYIAVSIEVRGRPTPQPE